MDNGCEAPPANTEDPNGSENNPDGTENNTNSKDSASNGTTDYPYTDPTSNANAYTSSGNTPKTPVPGSQGGCTQVQGSQATAGWLVMTLTLLSLVALRRREVRVCAEPRA